MAEDSCSAFRGALPTRLLSLRLGAGTQITQKVSVKQCSLVTDDLNVVDE